ncbi:hypothetical protein, partial [Bacillus cereus]
MITNGFAEITTDRLEKSLRAPL